MKNFLPSVRWSRASQWAFAVMTAGSVLACGDATGPRSGGGPPPAITALPRSLTVTESKVRDAANDFSFALLRTVSESQRTANTFISPLSASFALGMLLNGANAQSYDEIQTALQLRGLTQAEINAGYKSLVALLLSLDPSVQMRVANSIWYEKTFSVHSSFLDTTRKYFNAEVTGLNFQDKPTTLGAINGWVSTATNDKIKKVLDDISPDAVMFLINAIYFKGDWRDKFDVAKTQNGTFTPSVGSAQTVALMNRSGDLSYAETGTYQAVDLPYGNTAYSMTVVLPKAGQDVNDVAIGFTAASWQTLAGSFRKEKVDLTFPRLKLEYERVLNDDLKALGMKVPFVGPADFSRMTPRSVIVSFVKQNSFVDINEEGTEAAAVTTIGVEVVSAPQRFTVRVDRPYLFVIRERLSGTVVFMGRVVRIPG